MTSDDHTTDTEQVLGELRLGRQLTTAGHVAARAVSILIGLPFLLAGRAIAEVGPWAALAPIVSLVAVGLTMWSALELAGGSEERGGSYVLIAGSLGGLGAWLAGWSMLAATFALAAALAHALSSHVAYLFPAMALSSTNLALILFAGLALIQLVRAVPLPPLLWRTVLGLVAALGAILVSALPRVNDQLYRASVMPAAASLIRSVSWGLVSWVAFEAILGSRSQVLDARRNMPRAVVTALLAGSLGLGLVLLVAAGLGTAASSGDLFLASTLSAAISLPSWTVVVVAVFALALGTTQCLQIAVDQMLTLSRALGLLEALRTVPRPFVMPPAFVGAVTAATAALIVTVPNQVLAETAAFMSIVVALLLNLAAIYSHRSQPERRRWFVVPFQPLIPILTILASLVLLRTTSQQAVLGCGLWLLVGLVAYLTCARHHQQAIREHECVFGPEPRAKPLGVYRILVPIGASENRRLLLNVAASLASQLQGEIIPLQVIPTPDPLGIQESQRVAGEQNTQLQWSIDLGAGSEVPVFPITRLAHSVPQGILSTAVEEGCNLILMSWSETPASRRQRLDSTVDPVVREAPCDVAVLAFNADDEAAADTGAIFAPVKCGMPTEGAEADERQRASSILVPAAGGPHAPLAMRLALSLAQEYGATVTALYVAEADASAEEIAAGREQLEQTVLLLRQQAQVPDQVDIKTQVATAAGVVQGIADEGAKHDVVIMAASEERLIDQVIFGTVPEHVARACPVPVIMAKKYRGLPRLWLQRLWNTLYEPLPQLTSRQQAEAYRALRRGARPDVDFFVMMGLAAVIATIGLLQGSAAVIIGAMLVAPLFTPIMGLSMGIIRSDARLLALALESAVKGIALATGVAVALAMLTPLFTATAELSARTRPNLFDLAVALASGAAGAYAMTRKDVESSLPGVGIAASLVPPLCALGIGLARGEASVAGGAALLFATNLVAITLAGAIMLLLLGFRPVEDKERRLSLRRGFLVTIALVLLIALPLAAVFSRSVSEAQTRRLIEQYLRTEIGSIGDAELADVQVRERGTEIAVTATLYVSESVSEPFAAQLSSELSQLLGRPVMVRLAPIQVVQAQPSLHPP